MDMDVHFFLFGLLTPGIKIFHSSKKISPYIYN